MPEAPRYETIDPSLAIMAEEKKRRNAMNRQKTILTSGLGAKGEPPVAKKTLLGQ